MAGVGKLEFSGLRVQDGVQAGDEHVAGDIRAEHIVDFAKHIRGRYKPLGDGAQNAAGGGHNERRRDSLIGNVSGHHAQAAVGKMDEIIKIAADRASRLPVCHYLPARDRRQLFREQGLLDNAGHAHFLLEALERQGFSLLLAGQLGNAQRRGSLDREVVQQAVVVGRVLLFAQTRSEVEEADQFTLADQWKGYFDTCFF